jgi:hypothetical protein
MADPAHTVAGPAMDEGSELTVISSFTVQPAPNEYRIVAVPAATPVIIPVAEPTVATTGLLLLQIPPPASVAVTVAVTQTIVGPAIAAGSELTVIVLIAGQPPTE